MTEQNNKIEDDREMMGKIEKKEYRCPPKEYQIKQGQILNPKGKEKGTVNRSTVARQVLSMSAKPPEEILKNLKEMYPKFFEKKSPRWATEFLMTVRLAQRTILQGDVQAFNALMDNAYGKPKESVKLKIEEMALSDEQIKRIASRITRRKGSNGDSSGEKTSN